MKRAVVPIMAIFFGITSPLEAAITFGDMFEFSVGSSPDCVRSADFDRDGFADLVTANRGDATVSILLDAGDRSFESAVDYAVGTRPKDIAIGDFNGDAYPDLAVACDGADSISVLMNAGDGTFCPAVNYLASHADGQSGRCRPWHIETADFNNDTKLDILVSVTNLIAWDTVLTDKLYLYRGLGDGTFELALLQDVIDDPRGLCTGDFDNDGDIDIAVANRRCYVEVLVNRGNLAFRREHYNQRVYGNDELNDVVAVDLNDDGWIDLVSVDGRRCGCSVMINEGSGLFGNPSVFPVGCSSRLNLADMDYDNDMDILMVSKVFTNLGDGQLSGGYNAAADYYYSYPSSACGIDFDLDGDNDIAIAGSGSNTVLIRENTTGELLSFDPPITFPVGEGPHCVRPTDIDCDGNTDLVVCNRTSGTVSVLIGRGNITFEDQVIYPVQSYPRNVTVGDFNGDNYSDLAVANEGGDSISILLNLGDGTLMSAVNYLASHPDNEGGLCRPWDINTADFDSDGILDLIVSVTAREPNRPDPNDKIYLFVGTGDGTFTLALLLDVMGDPNGICVGDFDGDGDMDFATACRRRYVDVFINNGRLAFRRAFYPYNCEFWDVCADDFDGDGDTDLYALGHLDFFEGPDYRSHYLYFLRNDGSGVFDLSQSSWPEWGWTLFSADLNLDGAVDMLVANGYGCYLLNNGAGGWGTLYNLLGWGFGAHSICAADLDNDGDKEIAVVGLAGENVCVIKNTMGDTHPTDVDERSVETLPSISTLAQNYPNPFNPTTRIEYSLNARARVTITVYNLLGQEVVVLVDETQSAGEHVIDWDGRMASGRPAATGLYFYRLRAGDYVESKKMMLLK